MSTHKISNKSVCRPNIHTCEDLTDEDTCESYPNIRYCKWDTPNQNCVERIRNIDINLTPFTFTLRFVFT